MDHPLDTGQIKNWRSIITLIVFVLTNIIVLFPHFKIPIPIPRIFSDTLLNALRQYRIIPPSYQTSPRSKVKGNPKIQESNFVILHFPLNFITAPLIADLFLLAILAIGRQEVHDGTIGADHISPLDIMIFFLSLAYIAISIDASGLIRYLAYRVLEWGRKSGARLFFYLYTFFFLMTSFIGNDPVILSGTAFLAYMTRVASNIEDRKAWIHSQFAVANIGSAILVSSNPTNLVLAGAFNIKFVHYTVNMIVPVVVTAVVLFPFLLYIIFADKDLIPEKIDIHDLPESARNEKPINPNIPHAKDRPDQPDEAGGQSEESELRLLKEVLQPWSDMKSASFGAAVMATTLITLLALNAAGEIHQVFWITLPAAVIMFSWDVTLGWLKREENRETANMNRQEIRQENEDAAAEAEAQHADEKSRAANDESAIAEDWAESPLHDPDIGPRPEDNENVHNVPAVLTRGRRQFSRPSITLSEQGGRDHILSLSPDTPISVFASTTNGPSTKNEQHEMTLKEVREESCSSPDTDSAKQKEVKSQATFVSLVQDAYWWLQTTFPAAMTVLAHLPFALVPFALSMFVLVQALVTKGWVPVFAYGWDHWVEKTGTIGAIGGMGFLSVVLCNFAGTNIGTAILLSRVIQAWEQIHDNNGIPISDRTFWATVYSMALGVNYGAFSAAFSASLAGLLWRDILSRKHIEVRSLDFARVNLPIIAIAMTVGCVVLVGQVYIFRDESPYSL